MDTILNSETAWAQLTGSDDNMKVTECADAFLTLLMTITDRYSHLPQPGHRYFFGALFYVKVVLFRLNKLLKLI